MSQKRKERVDRGIKARSDDIFALNSYREMLYVAAPPLLPILALIILPLILPLYWKKVLISTAIFALLAMSWEFLVSVGMVSLGQALFFGAGAYGAGALGHYFDLAHMAHNTSGYCDRRCPLHYFAAAGATIAWRLFRYGNAHPASDV